jgi:hypothetical protein
MSKTNDGILDNRETVKSRIYNFWTIETFHDKI